MSDDLLDCLLSSAKDGNFEDALNGLYDDSDLKTVNTNPSVIHSGDTDSSDDEDNRNPEHSTLNECGKSIKNLIKPTSDNASTSKTVTQTWLSKPKTATPLKTPEPSSSTIFSIRVINPLIPSNVIDERMSNREVISFTHLKFFLRNVPTDKDWVIAGAIVQKTVKTSQKGTKYCMWTISDLKPDLKSVVVFLFGNAYKELWKSTAGTVVGILNPNVLDGKDGDREEGRFSVDNHQKVMVLGTSKDFGICKSLKKNGEHCTSFVNKSICEYCVYHMKQEYQQFTKRSDLQSGFSNAPRNLTELRNKVLGKDQVFYAGKLYTAVKNPKQVAKDNQRMKSLHGQQQIKNTKTSKKKRAAYLDVTPAQRLRDLKRLQQLGITTSITSEQTAFTAEPSQTVTAEHSKTLASKLKTAKTPIIFNKTQPTLTNTFIDLNVDFRNILKKADIVKTPKLSRQAAHAKQNAIKWVQANGPIKKLDPNNILQSKNPKKRSLETIEIPDPKIAKIQENEFFSERFKKIMATKSSHMDLVENYDNEQQEKYFSKLEMKERLEEKMITTYKMPCKAVKCLKCKYTNFSASDLCKRERHPLKVFDTVKRFFKCGNCENRTVCLEVVPTTTCKNCGHGKWERTGMMKERKIDIGAPKLSIRGGEQKFVNSVISNSSLDLLVPDE